MKRNVHCTTIEINLKFYFTTTENKEKASDEKERKSRGWFESRQGSDDDNHISFINIISDGNLKGNSVMSVLLFQGNQFTGYGLCWYAESLLFRRTYFIARRAETILYMRTDSGDGK